MSNMRPGSDGERSDALKAQKEHGERIMAEQDRTKEKKEKMDFTDSGIYKEIDIEIAIDETNELITAIDAEIKGYEQSLQKQADPSRREALIGVIERDRKDIEKARQRLNTLADLLEEAKKEP